MTADPAGPPAAAIDEVRGDLPALVHPGFTTTSYRQKVIYDTDPAVFWVNQTGTVMIIFRPGPRYAPGLDGTFGVLTPDGFTPFPAAVQRFFPRHQPSW